MTQQQYGPSLGGGEYSDRSVVEGVISAGGVFAHSESMEITNDPRFFQDNVLSLRLAAFGGMGVVAGLMVQNSLDNLFDMNKTMRFHSKDHHHHLDSWCQLIAMVTLSIVHYLNIIATYVGVAQPYHTIRLMTAGPTGFESAACYYLNKNIIAWRHFAVFGALFSMPLFLASSGLRMIVKFDRENYDFQEPASEEPDAIDRLIGLCMCGMFIFMACTVWYIHNKHWKVFDERYRLLKPNLTQHHQVLDAMTSRRTHLNA